MISLTPSKELVFNVSELEQKKTVSVLLKIENTTKERVLFKIKTTKPQNYHVKPNSGIIPASGTVTIQVALLEAALAPDKDGKGKEDKFLVQTVVESDCIEALPAVIADEAALVKERWSAVELSGKKKDGSGPSIMKNKLTCRLVQNENEVKAATAPAAAAAASAAVSAAPKAAAPAARPAESAAPKTAAAATAAAPAPRSEPAAPSDKASTAAASASSSTASTSSASAKTTSQAVTATKASKPGTADHSSSKGSSPPADNTMPSIILLFVVFLLGVIMGKFVI